MNRLIFPLKTKDKENTSVALTCVYFNDRCRGRHVRPRGGTIKQKLQLTVGSGSPGAWHIQQ